MNYTKPCHGNWACSPCGWNLKIRTCSSQGLPGGQLAHFTFVSGRNTEARVGESDEQASDMVSSTFLMMRRREPWCEQCRAYQPQSQVVVLSSVCSRSGNRAHVSLAHSASLSRLERSWFPAKNCPRHSSLSSKCRKPKGNYHLPDTAEVERATAKSTQRLCLPLCKLLRPLGLSSDQNNSLG